MSIAKDDMAYFDGPRAFPDSLDSAFHWPKVTTEMEMCVVEQMHDTLSIYDCSNVFETFERSYAAYHSREYALLSNSGTSSILAMFDAIGLRPGDEVLCPVYTFHAAVSPMMSLGAEPVFCDCDEFGNIAFGEVVAKTTAKTKAVVVTHMWGVPVAQIREIKEHCKRHSIYLLEDCSHAHGARLGGAVVGSFGDLAAWSLQGQKVITGGEGGILVTNSKKLYTNALLHGHYNKRPKQELRPEADLYKFFLTGKGLKLRAHPLAIAIAEQQFAMLDNFLAVKSRRAAALDEIIERYDFLTRPKSHDMECSWYAYGMQFVESYANGITREKFVDFLHAEGLSEFDIPGSTGLVNELPLFTHPNELFPALYSKPSPQQGGFDSAEAFYSRFIKLPVWAYEEDEEVFSAYLQGLIKVCEFVSNSSAL